MKGSVLNHTASEPEPVTCSVPLPSRKGPGSGLWACLADDFPLAQGCDDRSYNLGVFPMPAALPRPRPGCCCVAEPEAAILEGCCLSPHPLPPPFPSSSHFSSEREKLIENVSEQSHSRGGFSLFAAGEGRPGLRSQRSVDLARASGR